MRQRFSFPTSFRQPDGRGSSDSFSTCWNTLEIRGSVSRSSSFRAERAKVTEYLLTRAELSLGLQPLPDLLDGFARLPFSFLRYVGIVEVFPELPILFEVDQNRRFVSVLVNHELDALH